MDLGLQGKLIVVGGGAGGIGKVVRDVLRNEGAEVFIMDKKYGHDLSKIATVRALFDVLRSRCVRIDGYCSLVYGGGGETGFADCSPEEIQSELNGTLLAAVYPIQEAVRWMRETGGGHIVVVSSVNAFLGLNEFAYDMAKGALNRIAPDIATSCGKYGIYAVTLCPDNVSGTPTWVGREDDLANIATAVPDGKITSAREVANAVAFLLSEHGNMFNGSTLFADRGWTLKPTFRKEKGDRE